MITAIVYLINGIVVAIISYRVFLTMKKNNNSLFVYFFWTLFFYSLSYLKGALLIPIAIFTDGNTILYWIDFIGRILFYLGSAFLIQIPLYKYFPKSKNRYIFSFYVCILGLALSTYQLLFPNYPFVNKLGIINWQADSILAVGMSIIALASWVATSLVFGFEYLKDRKKIKSLLIGTGLLVTVIGGLFQDLAATVFGYVFFGVVLMLGFMVVFAGLYYEGEQETNIWKNKILIRSK